MDLRKELVEEGILTMDGVRFTDGFAWCELQGGLASAHNAINIRYLWASQCGRGHGTALLKKIIRVADRFGASLYLEVAPFWKKKTGKGWCFESIREGGLDKTQLYAWYGRNGFEKYNEKMMVRKARDLVKGTTHA